MIPANLTESAARIRALVLSQGISESDLAEAERVQNHALALDVGALKDLGAPEYDRQPEWLAEGLTRREMARRQRFTRRLVDLDPELVAWAVRCRAATVLLAAEMAHVVGVESLTTIKWAKALVMAAAKGE